ncbi:MAG: hypothetical protein ACREKQ_04030 [Candidatus Rokuibacteriota bacterium]
MIVSLGRPVVARALAAALVALGLLGSAAHAQPERSGARLDRAGLRTLLATLGYQPREARNESGGEFEITLRPPGGLAISTRVTLSKDATLVWLVAWLKKVPPGRTISGDAILDMLAENDAIGPTHFSYNESRRWFFLNRPVPNQGLTADRLRAELQQLGATVARTEALWDVDGWK